MSTKTQPDEIDVSVLTLLAKYPPTSIRAIGRELDKSHLTIMQRVKWLTREGYTQKAEDKRTTIITHKGMQYLQDIKDGKNLKPLHQKPTEPPLSAGGDQRPG